MTKKFLRSDTNRHSRIGKGRKKLQKWRRPRGRHNKIRRKRFGYPSKVSIGYKSNSTQTGLLQGRKMILVHNLSDLEKADKNSAVIIARVGAKKKMEIIKRAKELKIHLVNVEESK